MPDGLGPGIYYDLPADDYHRDPAAGGSLSSTGVKTLLEPSCPAIFKHYLDHGRPDKAVFDFGRAAHRKVLGAGEDLVVVDADDWRTKAAKTARDEARAAGKSPVLTRDAEVIDAMAEAIRRHPVAAALLDPDAGQPEVTLIWEDAATGVMLRARPDFLRDHHPGRRMIVPDYKTADHADPETFARSVDRFGYHTQADHYLDGIRELFDAPDPAFVFIVQERTAPYLVSCFELDHGAMAVGASRNRRARTIYRHCTETGHWPGYVPDTEPYLLQLPPWVERREGIEL